MKSIAQFIVDNNIPSRTTKQYLFVHDPSERTVTVFHKPSLTLVKRMSYNKHGQILDRTHLKLVAEEAIMKNSMKNQEVRELFLKEFKRTSTVNEAIDRIYKREGGYNNKRGWRFYVHLNKLPAVLKKKGLIKQIGEKYVDYSERYEKTWKVA